MSATASRGGKGCAAVRGRGGIVLAVLIFGAATAPAIAQTVPPGFQVATVGGVGQATNMAFLGPGDFFVLQKSTGRVMRVRFDDSGSTVQTVLTLAVNYGGESGMLGIALPPDFATTHDVFLYYTNASPLETHIDRFTWNGTSLTFANRLRVLPGGGNNHNGGILQIGPDNKLYAMVGELPSTTAGALTLNHQGSTVAERGVVLRMNRDGSAPSDNPFVNQPGWERIYAYGIRNSFGMAFDPVTGYLWDTENGESNYDEINRVFPGLNSGWDNIMGPAWRGAGSINNLVVMPGSRYLDPEFSWAPTVAPTGIVFLSSCRFPASIRNACMVAEYVTGSLSLLQVNASRDGFVLAGALADEVADGAAEQASIRWGTGFFGPTDLKIGPDGYLYVAQYNGGGIVRIRPQFPMGDINRDGKVDGDDIPEFVGVLLGGVTDPVRIAQADFDGNGVVNSADIPCFLTSLFLAF